MTALCVNRCLTLIVVYWKKYHETFSLTTKALCVPFSQENGFSSRWNSLRMHFIQSIVNNQTKVLTCLLTNFPFPATSFRFQFQDFNNHGAGYIELTKLKHALTSFSHKKHAFLHITWYWHPERNPFLLCSFSSSVICITDSWYYIPVYHILLLIPSSITSSKHTSLRAFHINTSQQLLTNSFHDLTGLNSSEFPYFTSSSEMKFATINS